jgi:hypothetical protein
MIPLCLDSWKIPVTEELAIEQFPHFSLQVFSFAVSDFSSIIDNMGDANTTLMWINRKWFFMLNNGTAALDWGEDMAQELLSGEFICYTADDYGHILNDDELTPLVEAGRIASFTPQQAAIYAWPPR